MDKAINSVGKRYWELDFVRGLCVALMIFDHAMFSFGYILPQVWDTFGVGFWSGLNELAIDYWNWTFRQIFREFVCAAFFVLCGISCTLSKSNFKRGFFAFCIAAVITYVTSLADSVTDAGLTIRFGVIHMLSVAILCYAALSFLGGIPQRIKDNKVTRWVKKLFPGVVGMVLFIIFFAVLGKFVDGEDGMGFVGTIDVDPEGKWAGIIPIFIKVRSIEFVSADYFPLLPYAAYVLVGSIIGELIYHTKAANYLSRFDGDWNKGLCFLGRHSLVIYVMHQVVIFAILFLVGFFVSL